MGRSDCESAVGAEELQPRKGRSFSCAEDETRRSRRRPGSPAGGIRS